MTSENANPRKIGRGPFRYTLWDAIPAVLVFAHLGALLVFFVIWPSLTWPERLLGACLYALAIGWNLDSVSHNFIHNPFFKSKLANRVVELALTLSTGTPQTMYKFVHMRHHAGNSDRPDEHGETVDPISLYKFGADGKVEPAVPYILMQFWRDDGPYDVARQIAVKRPDEARRALNEFYAIVGVYGAALLIHWQFVLVLAPFYYLGQSFSALIAYYEHAGANPDAPIATGVSTYEPVYNWLFLNNGYHAEHHYRPKWHWTRMEALRQEIREEQVAAGVRVIGPPHFLGFLSPSSWKIPTASKRKTAVASAAS